MPKLVSEIASGTQFQFTSSPDSVGASITRVFRILLEQPQEYVDIAQVCGIFVGDQHPTNPILRCTNYEAQFEGDSRMVILATFTFQVDSAWAGDGGGPGGGGGGGRQSYNPEIRPANWSVSSSMMEVPARFWRPVTNAAGALGDAETPKNPVGDIYDGVTRLEPIVTISIEQPEFQDPTKHMLHVGKTNKASFKVGSLDCGRRTVMLRNVQSRPFVEQYGAITYRGWNVSYEFAFRRNKVSGLRVGTGQNVSDNQEADIGWDIALPQTGFNVKMIAPVAEESFSVATAENEDIEASGYPLKHENYKIKGWPNSLEFIAGTSGKKARAMVLVHEYEDGGASQTPSAQPIPLNDNGTPRWSGADPKVIVRRYCVTDEIDFKDVLKLRLT